MSEPQPILQLRTSDPVLDRAPAQPEAGGTWLSLCEANRQLNIPLSSLRRYIDRHGRHIPTIRSGKKVLVARTALGILERIRLLYDSGCAVAAVEADLAASTQDAAPPSSPLADLQQRMANLDRKLSEMQSAIETRDLMIRQILAAIVHVIEAQDDEHRFAENERQIADNERDRQAAFQHQQVMLSLHEVLSLTRRRRWPW